MLRPVHTKNDIYKDNDKDIALKIVLDIKDKQSLHHIYNDKGTETRNDIVGITFRTICSSWWTIQTLTHIEHLSCYELENLKRRTSKKTTSFAGEDANIFIVIFIVFVLGVNEALLLIFHLLLKQIVLIE